MLKELFESHFYVVFPKANDKVLNLEEKTKEGDFAIIDKNACRDCRVICGEDINSREQLRINSTISVNIISMDQVFDYVRDEVGEICDYMMESDQTTALVEMTCSTSGYVKDKRRKARRQLYNTLCLLFASPIIKEHVESHMLRYVVFSWKETTPSDSLNDKVEKSMVAMTMMSDSVYSADNELNFDFDFKLREIRYPDVFVV